MSLVQNISITVDAVVFVRSPDPREGEFSHVLLVKRKNEPFRHCWALPGGFLDEDDKDLQAGAARELEEETGLTGINLYQVGAWGSPNRDPRGYTVTVAFFGIVDEMFPIEGRDDALEAAWLPIDFKGGAFDHEEIIGRALLRAS